MQVRMGEFPSLGGGGGGGFCIASYTLWSCLHNCHCPFFFLASLIVQVEDRDKSGPELKVTVRPTMTVLELKTMVRCLLCLLRVSAHAYACAHIHTHTHTHTHTQLYLSSFSDTPRPTQRRSLQMLGVAVPQIGVGVFHA